MLTREHSCRISKSQALCRVSKCSTSHAPVLRVAGSRLLSAGCRAAPNDPNEAPKLDFIESMVQALFGKKALNDPTPMGLKRINFDELPDQFVEMVKEAVPLDSDPPQLLPLRRLLANTRLEFSPLRLAYDADRDGWDPRAFHSRCGGFGAGLVVACTEGGTVFGGYNPEGWIGLGEDRASNGAFLFTWRGCAEGGMNGKATKLPKVGGSALAVMDRPDSGPIFGADGLSIPLRPKALDRTAKCKLGTYYARMPDGGRSLFGANEDSKRVQLLWLRVFVAEGEGEKWELEGLTWKTSQ